MYMLLHTVNSNKHSLHMSGINVCKLSIHMSRINRCVNFQYTCPE